MATSTGTQSRRQIVHQKANDNDRCGRNKQTNKQTNKQKTTAKETGTGTQPAPVHWSLEHLQLLWLFLFCSFYDSVNTGGRKRKKQNKPKYSARHFSMWNSVKMNQTAYELAYFEQNSMKLCESQVEPSQTQ